MSIDNKYMDVYGCPIKETQDALLASVNYAEAIDGLNGYFTSEPRNDYITIRRQIDNHTFFLYDPEKWADILISWLRTEHGIFYYPSMEAKHAKIERIPPFTERMMDEGALNSLKKLYKRVTGKEPEVDSHTLIAYGITEAVAESLSRNAEKSDINKLISDYCTKHDIIAPSPDSSDKACVEYLFSVVDLEREHRAAVGKQMVDDYEKDLLQFIYKEYGNRTHLNAETITYNPPNICNTITKIVRDYARNRIRVDILEGRIKCIFDKYKTKFTVDDQVINGDPTISFMLDCIWSWIGSSAELKQKCDFLEDELGKEAVIRECLNRRKMNQTKLGTIEKKLEELLKDVKEELP